LAIVIVGRAKYTRARAKVRGDATRRESPRDFARARVYFARLTIAIAKIRDYSQSNSEWIHQIKSKSGFLGFMIRAFLWGTDPKWYICQAVFHANLLVLPYFLSENGSRWEFVEEFV